MTKLIMSVEIEASPEEVFAFILDLKKMNDVSKWWDVGEWSSDGPVGVGSTAHYVGVGRNKGEWDLKVTEFVKDKKMTMSVIGTKKLALSSTNSYTLEPTTKGTKLTYSIDYEMPYSILGKLIDKFAHSRMEKGNIKFLEDLKKAVEA